MQLAYLGQIMHHGEVGRIMKHAQLGLMIQDYFIEQMRQHDDKLNQDISCNMIPLDRSTTLQSCKNTFLSGIRNFD